MGGRGSKGRASSTEPAFFDPLPLPEVTATPEEPPKPPKSSAAPEPPTEQVDDEPVTRQDVVRDAIRDTSTSIPLGGWQSLADLRAALPPDMTRAEVDAVLHRMRKDREFEAVPDPDRKNLRPVDHDAALTVAGQANHLLNWAPRDQAGALQRVTKQGVQAITNDDITAAMHNPNTPSELYTALHNEQKRRRGDPLYRPNQ
jgi:hypothetical protein